LTIERIREYSFPGEIYWRSLPEEFTGKSKSAIPDNFAKDIQDIADKRKNNK
jgi:hypothetical protein